MSKFWVEEQNVSKFWFLRTKSVKICQFWFFRSQFFRFLSENIVRFGLKGQNQSKFGFSGQFFSVLGKNIVRVGLTGQNVSTFWL